VTIRAILFDAAGTLIYLPRGVGWHYREVAGRHGVELDEKRVGVAFGAAFKAAGPRVVTEGGVAVPLDGRGRLRDANQDSPARQPPLFPSSSSAIGVPRVPRSDDDKLWWRALVLQVLAACGQEPADAVYDGLFEELYAHFAEPGVWALYPEAVAVLEALHGQYRLGVVSNFDRRLYPVLEHLGMRRYFEAIVISSELGVDKPDGRIFAAALSALGAAPGETVHAGDDPEQDWRAAENAGLHVYRVDRPARGLEGLPEYVRSLTSPRSSP
jgi:putative hydrolase of the HAD superfamily